MANIAVLALNDVDSDEIFSQYMKDHEEDGFCVYQFQNGPIRQIVAEIEENCQDVLLVYDAEEGVTPGFNGFVRELYRHGINPLVVILIHDGWDISVDEAEMLIPDIVSIYDSEFNSLTFFPRVVFFDFEKGFILDPEFPDEINLNFLLN